MNLFLADDDARARAALRLLFEHQPRMCVAGEAASGQALLAALLLAEPDVVLLDWELPGPPATAVVAGIRVRCPGARVVALSGRIEAYRAALAAGVDAFISKTDPPERLLTTLRIVARVPRGGDPSQTLRLRDT